MTHRAQGCLLAIALAATTSPAFAARDSRSGGFIRIYPQAKLWENATISPATVKVLADNEIRLDGDPGEKLTIVVDQNPFVYAKYKWEKETIQDSADYRALLAFGTALQGLNTSLFPKKAQEHGPKFEGAPIEVEEAPKTRLPYLADDFLPEFVRHYRPVFDRTKQTETFVGHAVAFTAIAPVSLRPATSLWVADSAAIASWSTKKERTFFTSAFDQVAQARARLLSKLDPSAALEPGDDAWIDATAASRSLKQSAGVQTLLLISAEQAHLLGLLDSQEQFQANAALVGHDLELKTWTVPNNQDLLGQVTITPLGDGKDVNVAVGIATYSPLVFGVGPSVVYSYVKSPFDGSRVKAAPVVMLTVGPRRWAKYVGTPELHLGLGGTSDSLGIFVGVGLRVVSLFDFVAGWSYQNFKSPADAPPGAKSTGNGLFLGFTLDKKLNGN